MISIDQFNIRDSNKHVLVKTDSQYVIRFPKCDEIVMGFAAHRATQPGAPAKFTVIIVILTCRRWGKKPMSSKLSGRKKGIRRF